MSLDFDAGTTESLPGHAHDFAASAWPGGGSWPEPDLHQALAHLFRRDAERLRAVAGRVLRNPADAEEAVQEGFLSACRNLHRFRGDAKLSTWIYRIVWNAALMRRRSRLRKPEVSIETLPEWSELPGGVRPDDEAERRATCRSLLEAASQLDDGQRSLLTDRYARGMRIREIARQRGIGENATKSRLHRARRAMRQALETN